ALNVQGLDTVVIDDVRFTSIVERGRNVLTKLHLGANEILQMAGRVHGRVAGGRVFILSDRDIDFFALQPTAPEFQLAGDSERVAITCADLGVDASELELPVPLDRIAYRRAIQFLEGRGIIEHGRLTRYGRAVEAMPVEREWAELLVNAEDDLVPYLAVMSGVESLHRMTRDERDLEGLIVPGSDHLTAYNLYAEAYRQTGYVGEVYGLPRHLFDEGIEAWAIEERGVLVKAIEDAALGMASIYRALELPLPERLSLADDRIYRAFTDLLARIMPFDLVIDEQTASGDSARVSKTSVCGSWGAIAGELRYFADRFGVPRASIEGTQIPYDLIQKYATRTAPEVVYDPRRKRSPLVVVRRLEYFGFELGSDREPIDEFASELAPAARHALADALARFEARHPAVKQNRAAIEELRSVYRRSGGRTAKLGLPELTRLYEDRLAHVNSLDEFRATNLAIEPDELVPRAERERYLALPGTTAVRDREVPIDYDVEEGVGGVAKLRLPEKMARTLVESELPTLDRPLRFVVPRGPRGAVRAATLDELQELLDRPWMPEEVAESEERHTGRRGRGGARRERAAAHARPRGRPGGKRRRRGR
ncbi:MAG TPA: DEAD/DEAH box helicase, partial [Gemmatimonadaceae bacterium]